MPHPDDLSAAEILARHLSALGPASSIDLERLCAENPERATELRRLTAHWEHVGDVVAALRGSYDLEERPPSPARPASSTAGTLGRLEARTPDVQRYQTRRELARGGMGAILEIWDDELRRTLAMKVVLTKGREDTQESDELLLTRFLEEAQVTAQLDHPGIVPVHELGLDAEGRAFFTMPLVRGRDLAQILELVQREEEDWTLTRAVGVLLKVCEAMAYAHSKQVIHRDLKPANVMVGRFGEVYVMDWGLARVMGREDKRDLRLRDRGRDVTKSLVSTDRDVHDASPLVTMDGDVVGTPSYMSPEQARGELELMGPHSDVYSVGAILYHLLASHMPYVPPGSKRNAYGVWGLLQEEPPAPLREVARRAPEELVAICDKAMSRDIEARYPEMLAMASDLRAYIEGHVVRAHATGALPELRKWIQRNRALAWTSVAAFLVITTGLVLAAWMQVRWRDRLEEKETEVTGLFDTARERNYVANLIGAAMNREVGNFAEMERRLEACPPELRGWEWDHLILGENPALLALPGGAQAVAWDTAGCFLAGTHDGQVHRREGKSGGLQEVRQLHTATLACLTSTPDAGLLASGGLDGTVAVWSGSPGRARTWPCGERAVRAIALSPDGARLATGEGARYRVELGGVLRAQRFDEYRLHLWDAESGERIATLEGHSRPVRALCFLSDGRLASASEEGEIALWDLTSGERTATLSGHQRGTFDLVEAPGGRLLSAGGDDAIGIWNLAGLQRDEILTGHGQAVLALDLAPDGRRVVSSSADGTVRTWDLVSLQELSTLRGHEGEVGSVAFSPDGQRILSAGFQDGLRLWDSNTIPAQTPLRGHDHRLVPLTLTWEGGGSPGVVWLVDLDDVDRSTPGLLATIGALDPDGDRLALCGRRHRLKRRYEIDIWEVATAELTRTLDGHADTIMAFAWGPRCRRLASGASDGSVKVWNAQQGSLEISFQLDAGVGALVFHPEGHLLAAGDAGGRVVLIDPGTGTVEGLVEEHEGRVRALAWSDDGRRLASGGADDSILLWDRDHPERAAITLLGHQDPVTCLAFGPRGERLFSGSADTNVRVWHTSSATSLLTLTGANFPITGLKLERGGRRLITWEASRKPVVKVWESSLNDLQSMWRACALERRAAEVLRSLEEAHQGRRAMQAAFEARSDLDPEIEAIVEELIRRAEE